MSIDMKRVTKIPLEKLRTPFNDARVVCKLWWVILDGCALLYNGHAIQGNANRSLAENLGQRLYPGSTLEYLEAAFLPDSRRV